MLARSIPGVRVVVDGQRYLAGQWLLGKGVPVTTFLLDDGYQHLRLARDLNLLLIDAGDPLPRARMIPEGRLREPLDQLYRADAVIVTRCDEPHDEMALATLLDRHLRHGTPVFHAAHALTRFYRLGTGDPVDTASIGRAGAIAGIARPERFYHDLRARGLDLVWTGSYPDHHRYSPADLQLIATRMAATGAQSLLMTEKDAANWPPGASAGLSLVVCQIEFRCREDEQLRSLLQQLRT
ncbi:MAG: tetraacyldisaccharide 4'-kinase [Acidobacteria bacterium]|nr:tetraacyldisaccharide 4'-kinase [Acidobacteriota bacterium]